MSAHAKQMDAVAYWRQYEVKMSWEIPYPDPRGEVKGVLEALRETRTRASEPWTPRLAIRRDDGILVLVDVYQERLAFELSLHAPILVGERVCIRYIGEDKRAPAGMSPTKRFRVWVDGRGDPDPGVDQEIDK